MTTSKQLLQEKIHNLQYPLAIPKQEVVIELHSERDGIDLLGRITIVLIKDQKLIDRDGYEFSPVDIYAEEDVQKILMYLTSLS